MNSAGLSMRVFGLYLVVVGAVLMVAPNAFLAVFGLPQTPEPWIRVVGVLATALAFYYLQSAQQGWTGFWRASVFVRAAVFAVFLAFVLAGLAPTVLILFGAIDLAGAAWTFLALRGASRPT